MEGNHQSQKWWTVFNAHYSWWWWMGK